MGEDWDYYVIWRDKEFNIKGFHSLKDARNFAKSFQERFISLTIYKNLGHFFNKEYIPFTKLKRPSDKWR